MSSGRMTAEDHHAQDALERLAVARLQKFAERQNRAVTTSAAQKFADVAALLAGNEHTWRSLLRKSAKARAYSANLRTALPAFFADLCAAYPDARFDFTFIGTEGRLAQVKGDCEITVVTSAEQTTKVSLSLKNYENGPARIQVKSGTFQSFALSFYLESVGIGRWKSQLDGSEKATQATDFRVWRDKQLTSIGGPLLVAYFSELDELNDGMRKTFLGDEFRFYDEDAVARIQKSTGIAGATVLKKILDLADGDTVRARLLDSTGLLGDEDLLVFGKGLIADTLTDKKFAQLLERLRHAELSLTTVGQSLRFVFSDKDAGAGDGSSEAAGTAVLSIDVPCTINTNGAWYRDGEPYEGTRYHKKEDCELAWGERRPKKSREIATSINTYLDLGSTGVLRSLTTAVEQ